MLLCIAASAQTAEEFKEKYNRQVRNTGAAGVGVETILDKWLEAYPGDCDALEGRFAYYWAKSRKTEVVAKDSKKYLGTNPVLTLKDSLGNPVYYFEEPFFDESLFAESTKNIEEAIKLAPTALEYRFDKINALIDYEKDSPDMAATELLNLIDYDSKSHPMWYLRGESVGPEDFETAIQEYCYTFYNLNTPNGYNSFKIVSEKMSSLHPSNPDWLANIGAYYQVAKKDNKKATKYYKKALKLDPNHFAANRNMKIMEKNK